MEQETIIRAENASNMGIRPLQVIPWAEKTKDWFVSNINYYISKSNYNFGASAGQRKDLYTLYNVYNNQFPLDWFKHITNPLSAKKTENKAFPAKIRPVSILRTNVDLLLGEWPHRPYVYQVRNLGESGYSNYMDSMQKTAQGNLTQHFIQSALQHAKDSGQQLTPEQLQQLQSDPPLPDQVKQDFKASYKDAIAIKAQKWMNRTIESHEVKRRQHKMFKDWMIVGEAYSYKTVENDTLIYKEVSPMNLDFDKSTNEDFVEDGEWVVHREYYTLSDVVDKFYEVLAEENLKDLESKYYYGSSIKFYDFVKPRMENLNKIPVYHVQWKGRKKIGFLSYIDPETFQLVEEIVDEDYPVDESKGEQVEWKWVNEVYEGWRIGADIYTRLRACPHQRNEMNNHSKCKLSYNGRKYSDTHSENISPMEIGVPFQIMYIIVNYILEKTIAKSKGKIILMDLNTIPDNDEWDEEKFFYYGEAMGYALIDRNQVGVDKSWNQYQVLDMGLFDQIKQLIELLGYFKQQWDDIIGINRQRKGQTLASDGQGVNERATFQSTVITDMIFIRFEELVGRDLQGIMDLAKYLTAKGMFGTYNDDDYGEELLKVMPGDFSNEDLGIFLQNASKAIRKLEEMKQYAQAMLQNDHKPSTVLEIIDAVNIADLKAKLKQIEEIDEQIQQMQVQSEQDAAAEMDKRKEEFAQFQSLLDIRKMNVEFDRKEDIEYIKGMFNTFTFQNGDSNANGVPDAAEVVKLEQAREQMKLDHGHRLADRQLKYDELDQKERALNQKAQQDRETNKLKAKQIKVQARKKAASK